MFVSNEQFILRKSYKPTKREKSIGKDSELAIPRRTLINLQVQFSSVAQSCPTLGDPMNRSTPGLPVHHQPRSLPKLMSIKSVMPSSHIILCCPLLLPPSIFPSIRIFSNSSSHQVAKVLELQHQSFQ